MPKRLKSLRKDLYLSKQEASRIREELQETPALLEERFQELDGLSRLLKFADDPALTVQKLLELSVDLIPSCFRFSPAVYAVARLNKYQYRTEPFMKTDLVLSAPIRIKNRTTGSLHAFLPDIDPFFNKSDFILQKKAFVTTFCKFIGIIAAHLFLFRQSRRILKKGAALTIPVDTESSIAVLPPAEALQTPGIQIETGIPAFVERTRFEKMIGKSEAMQQVYELIQNAADSDASVCISGESGTGKELAAKAVHNLSHRKDNVFAAVNCGAIPESLFESEFFGHEKGAFTGAASSKKGYLNMAHMGTVFLDELGELPKSMQIKLLRAFDNGEFSPVGSNRRYQSDFRIITATARDLKTELSEDRLRKDFFFRVYVIPITMPPLRERKEDLPYLVEHCLKQFSKKHPLIRTIPEEIMDRVHEYDWPGNVRELQNVLLRFITTGRFEVFTDNGEWSEPGKVSLDMESGRSLAERMDAYEKRLLLKILTDNDWNRTRVSRQLGISRNTLFRKVKKYGLQPIQS